MKKLFASILISAVCFGAFAQESNILESWSDKVESSDNDIISYFSFLNFTYNNFLGASTIGGVNMHGWGFEMSALHIGFNPWNNGRFTLGLFDMCFDFGYLLPGWDFIINPDGAIVTNSIGVLENSKSQINVFAYTFPIGYIHHFGFSKWSAGIFAAPGLGWESYRNEYVQNNIKHTEKLNINRNATYFRLNVEGMIWYDNVGLVVRYAFPKNFQGVGVISAGISLRV